MATETKSTQILIRVRPSLKAAADMAAKADNRSLSALIEKLLGDYLKKTGFLAPQQVEPRSLPRATARPGKAKNG